jgi:imidazolonepropionase-like amidohydrolase
MPDFIDTHGHLTMDASNLTQQTLQSSAAKALKGLNLAQEYISYGFTTLRDLGSMDPQLPTVDLRNALNAGLVNGTRLVVAAAHVISLSGAHGHVRGFYGPRWDLPISRVADGASPDHRVHQHPKQVHQVKRHTEKQQPPGGPIGLETSQPFIRPPTRQQLA